MRWDLGYEYVMPTHCSYANARCIGRQSVPSSRVVPSHSHHATALTGYTGAFTTMLMTTAVCMSTAAVVRTWILQLGGYGRSLSCVGGAAPFLRDRHEHLDWYRPYTI